MISKGCPKPKPAEIKSMLARLEAVRGARTPDVYEDIVTGARHALRYVLGMDNRLEHWIGQCEDGIRRRHKEPLGQDCTCPVCVRRTA